jgi:hypothetical protein
MFSAVMFSAPAVECPARLRRDVRGGLRGVSARSGADGRRGDIEAGVRTLVERGLFQRGLF